jgi:hypothetical protein
MAPYWAEYEPLLIPGQVGVPGYRPEFAIDSFFAGAEVPQPALAAYLQALQDHASGHGRVAVFKFCRSLGRVGWMRERFPHALHMAVLRRPQAQWESARRQMEVHGNPYFVAMPLLLLARNAQSPLVARVCRALRVPLPRLRQTEPQQAIAASRVLRDQLSWDDRYRAFLAYWMACALSALAADCLFVDADMLTWSAYYREEVAAVVARASGLALQLVADPARRSDWTLPLEGEQEEAQQAALTLLQESRAGLRPQGYLLAWNKLAEGLLRRPAAPLAAVADAKTGWEAIWPPRPRFRNPWARHGVGVGGR